MSLERELSFFRTIQQQLIREHDGKIALIVGDNLIGVFDKRRDAYKQGVERFGNIPMLIKAISSRLDPASSVGWIAHYANR